MAASSRPGGLTALAVFNFLFGAGALLNAVGTAIDNRGGSRGDGFGDLPSQQVLMALTVFHVIEGALLIVSGVGYLREKWLLGRVLGSIGGLVGVIVAVLTMVLVRDFNILTMMLLIYPLMTLVLLNTTFRHDFPNA